MEENHRNVTLQLAAIQAMGGVGADLKLSRTVWLRRSWALPHRPPLLHGSIRQFDITSVDKEVMGVGRV